MQKRRVRRVVCIARVVDDVAADSTDVGRGAGALVIIVTLPNRCMIVEALFY
jgi:hypothetical protein